MPCFKNIFGPKSWKIIGRFFSEWISFCQNRPCSNVSLFYKENIFIMRIEIFIATLNSSGFCLYCARRVNWKLYRFKETSKSFFQLMSSPFLITMKVECTPYNIIICMFRKKLKITTPHTTNELIIGKTGAYVNNKSIIWQKEKF